MRLETVDEFSDAFEEIALHSPEATFYHTGVWLRSLGSSFSAFRVRCLAAMGRSEVLGYLPFVVVAKGPLRSAWSLPFGTYGGPVAGGDEKVCRALLDAYAGLKASGKVHEIGLVDFANRWELAKFAAETASTHVIPLSGNFSDLWEGAFEKSKRRQTRKALKEGLRVAEARTQEELSRYYAIYAQRVALWRERFRYPERLFAELFAAGSPRTRLFVVWKGEEMLGGHLNFYFRDSVIAWNGVVRDTADGTQASTLLYAECIRHACENGYRSYNLGGSLGKRSLADYKESLGGVPYFYRTYCWRSTLGRAAAAIKSLVSRR